MVSVHPVSFAPRTYLSLCVCRLLQSQDFISKLLMKAPQERLGMGPNGAQDIMSHVWFSDIDFDALMRKEVTPPWSPDVKGVMDFK